MKASPKPPAKDKKDESGKKLMKPKGAPMMKGGKNPVC